MKQAIVDHLRLHGRTRLAPLAEILGITSEDLRPLLLDLRKDGRVRVSINQNPFWYWDEDFRCKDCSDCWPEVRRVPGQSICHGCFQVRYQPLVAVRKHRKNGTGGPPNYIETRLSTADVDQHFAGQLAAEWARRPLVNMQRGQV